ncbi:MAG: glutamyl-tRNA reductase [Halobacteriota archaeon]|nr:glutamyl-tRNA reductase [Halobacteriota archaeon]
MTEITSMLVTHVKASVRDIETAWHGNVDRMTHKMLENELVSECVILKTCNRVEVYVVSPKGSKVLYNFARKMRVPERIIDFHDHEESLRHLLRLSSGLESMIIGEDQILGQIKKLHQMAMEAGSTGRVLDTAFTKAIQVGKRVRTETKINEGSVSIGSAAVDLSEEILGGLCDKKILVIGAGEIGTLVSKALCSCDGDGFRTIYVANRTFERAETLANQLCGLAVQYDDIMDYLKEVDVVISATGAPHKVIKVDMMKEIMEERADQKLLIIDIANPRDVEDGVGDIPGIELHNIDSLKLIGENNLKKRLAEVKKAEEIIEGELENLKIIYRRQEADRIIEHRYNRAKDIEMKEVERAINRLNGRNGDLNADELETIIKDLANSITSKYLAYITMALREAAKNEKSEMLEVAAEMFGLQQVGENVSAIEDEKTS